MMALIRKDLDWLLVFLGIGLYLFTDTLLDHDFNQFWVMPGNNHYSELHLLYSVAGIILGITAVFRDEISRTEEFLFHRAVSSSQFFWAKLLACFTVMVLWITVPMLLSLSRGFWSVNASIIYFAPLGYSLGTGAVMFSCFSICFFAGTLRIPLIKRIIFGGASYVTLMYFSCVVTLHCQGGRLNPLMVYLCIHAAFTFFPLYAAYFNMLHGRDIDRPQAFNALKASCALATFSVAALLSYWISERQDKLQHELFNAYPAIMHNETMGYHLANWDNAVLWHEHKYYEVNERHEPVRYLKLQKDRHGNHHFPQHWNMTKKSNPDSYIRNKTGLDHPEKESFFGREVTVFDTAWQCIGVFPHHWDTRRLFWNRLDGMIYLIQYSTERIPVPPQRFKLGKGPENRPFTGHVSSISWPLPDGLLILVDNKEQTIWHCDLNKDQRYFTRLRLPDDDCFLECYSFKGGPKKTYSNDSEPVHLEDLYFAVEGKNAFYVWDGKTFRKEKLDLEKDLRIYYAPPVIKGHEAARFVLKEHDPLSPEAGIYEKDEILYSHHFNCHTVEEKQIAVQIYGLSMCKMPIIQWTSFFGTHEPFMDFQNDFMFDPLLASGKRFWLLAANLALAGLLAALAVRRLRRFGAERNRIVYWGILVFLGGVAVYVVYRLFETKRAYRKSKVVLPGEVPPLLICSEQGAGRVPDNECQAPATVLVDTSA